MPSSSSSDSSLRRTLQHAGGWAAGAYAAALGYTLVRERRLPPPSTLPYALNAEARTVETDADRANVYVRPGTGRPVVLLHSFNAAASSFEMQPLFEHFADTTDRPLYALDWLGFGRSARPAIDYQPALYEQQVYRLLREHVHAEHDAPADLIGLSLGAEYAAWVALQAAPLVRRLVLIAPTGLGPPRQVSPVGRLALATADRTRLFDLAFAALTRRASLLQFYRQQVFLTETVPKALVDYAYTTTHARGAPRAPRRFIDGTLFHEDPAHRLYERLYRPTLLAVPSNPASTVQRFGRLDAVLRRNERFLRHVSLDAGLLPHWEDSGPLFEAVDAFLADE
jgi:pimeloyl-ACP methyl ester carboxylesterase